MEKAHHGKNVILVFGSQFLFLLFALSFVFNGLQNIIFSDSEMISAKDSIESYYLNKSFEMGLQCLRESDSPYGYPYNTIFERDFKKREEHFKELINLTAPYRNYPNHCWAGYCGPWIEDVWIKTFMNQELPTFGPYIPVFVNWLNMWKVVGEYEYKKIVAEVFKLLKPNFLYITVVQSCFGIEGWNGLLPGVPNNMLIFTPASKGHIPIPHLKGIQSVVEMKPIKYETCFVGGNGYRTRRETIRYMRNEYKDKFFEGNNLGSSWKNIHAQTKVVLSPRGAARGCWRTYETLQQGFIPAVIFDDHVWMPYRNSSVPWEDMAMFGLLKDLPSIDQQIKSITPERREEMRKTILKYRDSHFTYEGVMNQIRLFMKGMGDLRCDKYYRTM